MKQLYHTSCKKGQSVSGNSGFQVRAVTDGVPDGRARAMLPFVGYEIPLAELDRTRLPEAAPVRLALFEAPNAGRIIVHGVYVGPDPTTGRDGNYFSHLLCDVPDTVDAAQVLSTWGSEFWRTRDDDDIGTKLDDIQSLPSDGRLNEDRLTGLLQESRNQDMFRFLLDAWLALPDDGRIFLAADATDIATCLWGLTRCLPEVLWKDLTFSTYEKNPLTSYARVVGAWWGNTQVRDLPHACYRGKSLGFNRFTERPPSPLPRELAYSNFIVRSCAAGTFHAIDDFHTHVTPDILVNPLNLDLLCRLLHEPSSMTTEELQAATEVPQLRACVLDHPSAISRLTRVAIVDSRYAAGGFRDLLDELGQDPERLDQVSKAAVESAHAAALDDNVQLLQGFFEGFLPTVRNALQDELAQQALEGLETPAELPAQAYDYLLPRAVRWFSAQRADEQVDLWLAVSADKLQRVLARDLDQVVKVRACMTCLSGSPEDATALSKAIGRHAQLVIPVMKEVMQTPTLGEGCAAKLFCDVLSGEPSQALGRELLARGGQLPPRMFDTCFRASLEAGLVTPRDVAANHAHKLPLTDGHCVLICQQLVDDLSADELIGDRPVSSFLEASVNYCNLPPGLRCKLEGLLLIRKFVDAPSPKARSFHLVTKAIDEHVPSNEKRPTIQLVGRRFCELIAAQQSPDQAWGNLEDFLSSFGRIVEYRELYEWLLSQTERQPGFWRNVPVLHAFLACGFGVSCRGRGVPWSNELVENATGFARELAKRGGHRTFRDVKRHTQSWRDHGGQLQLHHWRGLAREIEPISVRQRIGKAVSKVSGLVAALCRRRDDSVRPPPRQGSRKTRERAQSPRSKSRPEKSRKTDDDPGIVFVNGDRSDGFSAVASIRRGFYYLLLVGLFAFILWLLSLGDFLILRILYWLVVRVVS